MLWLVKTARHVAPPVPWMLAAPMASFVFVFQYAHMLVLLMGGTPKTDPHVVDHLAMFGALVAVTFASCAARTLRWTTTGSAAGLWIATFALAARVCCVGMIRIGGLEGYSFAYDAFPRIARLMWVTRNLTLVAFGYGLGLVVFSTIADARRRRRDPAWVSDDA